MAERQNQNQVSQRDDQTWLESQILSISSSSDCFQLVVTFHDQSVSFWQTPTAACGPSKAIKRQALLFLLQFWHG